MSALKTFCFVFRSQLKVALMWISSGCLTYISVWQSCLANFVGRLSTLKLVSNDIMFFCCFFL